MLYTSSDFLHYLRGREKLSISFLETRAKEIREEISELPRPKGLWLPRESRYRLSQRNLNGFPSQRIRLVKKS